MDVGAFFTFMRGVRVRDVMQASLGEFMNIFLVWILTGAGNKAP